VHENAARFQPGSSRSLLQLKRSRLPSGAVPLFQNGMDSHGSLPLGKRERENPQYEEKTPLGQQEGKLKSNPIGANEH
jgi:hypothetical protein